MECLSALLWLSLNIYFEARSEDQIDQIAVGLVTINRAHSKKQTIKSTVLKPYSFSWTHQKQSYLPDDPKAFITSIQSAWLSMQAHNFIGTNTTHYHHKKIKPYWASKMTYIGTFGNHKFYKPIIKISSIQNKVKL